jgi:hypothetical protein
MAEHKRDMELRCYSIDGERTPEALPPGALPERKCECALLPRKDRAKGEARRVPDTAPREVLTKRKHERASPP